MKKFIKFPLVLGIVALCSGALLSGVYNLTETTIRENKVERQTSALKNLFTSISDSEEIELSQEDIDAGITAAIKVVSKGKTYYTYQISFLDDYDSGESSFILVVDSNGKVSDLEFVSTIDNYAKKYATEDFKKSIIGMTKVGEDLIVTGATFTGEPMLIAVNQALDNYGRAK